MIIGIVSPALHVKSGYGIQADYLARRLAADGHQVIIFPIAGVGAGTLNIGGFTHYSGGRLAYQADALERHVHDTGAELILTLCDLAHQDANTVRRLRAAGRQVLHWVPVDCEPLSMIDEAVLHYGGGTPIAMSRFGERMLAGAGFDPLYVPHAVDAAVFAPMPAAERQELRGDQGTAGKFVIAWNGANADWLRKGQFELWQAYAAFLADYRHSILWLHTDDLEVQYDHTEDIRRLGLEKAVMPVDGHMVRTGQLDAGYMAAWYNAADVFLNTSWGEGFGVPLIEAQACGLPAIGTDCSAVTELVHGGGGWLVASEPKASPRHKRAWRAPLISGITRALGKAHHGWSRGGTAWQQRRDRARAFALAYDADAVYEQHWRPVLARAEAGEFREDGPIARSGGLRWHQDPADNRFGDRLALEHESALEPAVFRGLAEDGVFMDVGAHVGHWALRAAKRCARVIAVEANPVTAARLLENIELNGLRNVISYQLAAWDEPGELYVHNHHGGAPRDGTDQVKAEPSGVPVQAVRLDALLAGEPRIDVIKIDVEGADLHVLRGLAGVLKEHRPRLFIEDHSVHGMYEKQQLGDALTAAGYKWRDVALGYTEAVPRGEDPDAW